MDYSILILIGSFLIGFGVLALLFPGLEKVINFPGNARIKAFGVMGTGVAFIVASLLL